MNIQQYRSFSTSKTGLHIPSSQEPMDDCVFTAGKPKKQKSGMLSFGAKRPRNTTRSRPRSSVSPGGSYIIIMVTI